MSLASRIALRARQRVNESTTTAWDAFPQVSDESLSVSSRLASSSFHHLYGGGGPIPDQSSPPPVHLQSTCSPASD